MSVLTRPNIYLNKTIMVYLAAIFLHRIEYGYLDPTTNDLIQLECRASITSKVITSIHSYSLLYLSVALQIYRITGFWGEKLTEYK